MAKHLVMTGLQFIEDFSMSLMRRVLEMTEPLHMPGSGIRSIGTLRNPIGRQGDLVESALKYFLGTDNSRGVPKRMFRGALKLLNRAILLDVEMGGGKTFMYLRVIQGLIESGFKKNGVYNIAITCPTTNLRKVAREIKATIPGARIKILNDRNGVKILQRDFSDTREGVTFWVVGITRIRMHHARGVHVMSTKRDMAVNEMVAGIKGLAKADDPFARCPHCGQVIHSRKKKGKEIVVEPLTVSQVTARYARCPEPKFPNATTEAEKSKVCGFPLIGNITESKAVDKFTGEKSTRRHATARDISVGWYFLKRLKGKLDIAVLDEVQEGRNDGPQGVAMGWLAQSAKLAIASTGTLLNGYPESIWHLIWRLNPKSLLRAGFTRKDFGRFTRVYGCKQTTIRESRDGKRRAGTTNRPGISAKIYPDLLSSWSIFMGLLEVFHKTDMPGYKEVLVKAPLHPDQKSLLETAREAIRVARKEAREKGFEAFHSLLARYILTSMTHPDNLKSKVIDFLLEKFDEDGKLIDTHRVKVEIPKLEMEFTPKEKRIIKLVRRHKKIGRKSLVYFSYTNDYDCAERLRTRFEKAGIKAAVIRSSKPKQVDGDETFDNTFVIPAHKREEWIETEGKHFDVLITNPELVKTGLDLLGYPTIIFYQPVFDIITLRQAARRSWRYGQTQPVRVYFAYFKDSYQEDALARVASKLDTTLLAEGNSDDSELFDLSFNEEGDVLRGMIKALEETEFGAKLKKLKEPPKALDLQDASAQNIVEVLERGTLAAPEPVVQKAKPVARPAKPVEAPVVASIEEQLMAQVVTEVEEDPVEATAAEEAEVSEKPSRVVYASYVIKEGRRKKVVTEETSIDQVESGTQLSIFG